MKTDAGQRAFRINQLEDIIQEIEQLKITENEDEEIEQELAVSKKCSGSL